jgi:hypothetical protein
VTKTAAAKTWTLHERADGSFTSAALPPLAFPGASWATDTAANLGMDSTAISTFTTAVGGNGHLSRWGTQVATWGTADAKTEWASAAKPVTAMMLFFAQEEAEITSPNDLVEAVSAFDLITKDETMTLAHLANMVSGYSRAENPGAAWAYNDYAVQLFAETVYDNILTSFGATPNDIFLALADLDFQDGSIFSSRNGYGITTSVRDFARIGLLWLAKGQWGASQLIPRAYFTDYCKPLVPGALPESASVANLDNLGLGSFGGTGDAGTSQSGNVGPGIYGFGWWFNSTMNETADLLFPSAPTDLFMAQGHFGDETVVVIPSLGLVCACDSTGGWGNITTDGGVEDSDMDTLMSQLAATVS